MYTGVAFFLIHKIRITADTFVATSLLVMKINIFKNDKISYV